MRISTPDERRDYNIEIGRGALLRVGDIFNLNRKTLVVTDSGVPKRYAETVALRAASAETVTVPAGEGSKSFDELQRLLRAMTESSFTRSDCVVAVGGGVVGDLAGFAASCYMRGIDFYNVPTTLLSQVDSSIGGKSAVDFMGVKNIVGAFHQPRGVIVDPDVLRTLSARQLHAGLAEAVKMAAAMDGELFSLIEKSDDLTRDLQNITERSLKLKANVVEQDPREKGLRRVLNFGHTIGHAIESAKEGSLLHGECVALGMIAMSSGAARERIAAVLQKYGLPVSTDVATDAIKRFLVHDKKAARGKITVVTVDEIGSFKTSEATTDEIMKRLEVIL